MQVQPKGATPHVTGAIRQAARTTGASFDYLLATAQIESNLNPVARASTSSAQGLYQFIDQTWLGTMKRSGANPRVSAMMAGAYASSNAAQLTDGLGRAPSEGELYIAHFLGSDGASRLIGAALSAPNMKAADLFPQAAAANRAIFYDAARQPRGVLDVYRTLTARYEMARAGAAATAAASVAPSVASTAPLAALPLRGSLPGNSPSPRNVAVAAVPDTAGLTSAYADARTERPRTVETRPLFQSMFTTPGRQGVSPVVSSLWTGGSPANPATPDNAVPRHDLFTDPKPGTRPPPGGKV